MGSIIVYPGNEYELLYWNGSIWKSAGYRVADSNELVYEDIPLSCLLWIRSYTHGKDKRPFIISEEGKVDWW